MKECMKTFLIFLVIVICLLSVSLLLLFLYVYFKGHNINFDTSILFIGGQGSGKTYNAFALGKKLIFKKRYERLIKNITIFIKNLFRKKSKRYNYYEKPYIYSNLPFLHQKKYGRVLTIEHIMLIDKIPPLSVIIIDELSDFCNQWDYKESNVIDNLTDFMRYIRHYTLGGVLICTDHCLDNIAKPIRSRIGAVYYLYDFKMLFKPIISVFYYVKYIRLLSVEGITHVVNSEDAEKVHFWQKPYLFGFHIGKVYDTYAYYEKYKSVPRSQDLYFTNLKSTSNYNSKLKSKRYNKLITENKDVYSNESKKYK